ncbi:MAG: PHP domain-containing protein, partial [Dehalococcoidia bacterium]
SIPHPFDRFRNSVLKYEALESILSQVDIIEVFNSRTTLLRDSEKARRFAQEHGFLCGAGSDAHTPMELGNVYVEMPNFNGPEEFKEALAKGKIIARRTNPLIHLTTAYTKIKKRLWLSQN